ncbi:MAG: hypothetical protein HYX90_07060 [Chloroflexi bacterium]|nr:hypothetical protein [Chloroflexota bacterium]
MVEAFRDAADDPWIGVLVVTGTGDRAFCAGGDLNWEAEGISGAEGVMGLEGMFGVSLLEKFSQDAQEGRQAFFEKRKPDFWGGSKESEIILPGESNKEIWANGPG